MLCISFATLTVWLVMATVNVNCDPIIQETLASTACHEMGYVQCASSPAGRRPPRCILASWICDGEDDCGNNSDEPQSCAERVCESGQLKCDSGQCINKELFCVGVESCTDGSLTPRNVCPSTICPFGHVVCPSTDKCIREAWLCDGDSDCANNWDESPEICREHRCLDGSVKCNSGQCINKERFCSGLINCPDDTRIADVCPSISCEPGWSKCSTVNKCIKDSWFCDGDDDCADGSDEENAFCVGRSCAVDSLRCDNGQCIDQVEFCERSVPCRDNSLQRDFNTCPGLLSAPQPPGLGCMLAVQLKCSSMFTPEFASMASFSQHILTSDLAQTCSPLREMASCMVNSLSNDCSESDREALPREFKQLLAVYTDAIHYICAEHLAVFEKHKTCLFGERDSGQNLLSLIERHCDSIDQQSSGFCMSHGEFECAIGFIRNACDGEIAGHISALGKKIMTDIGCPADVKRRGSEKLVELLQRMLSD